MISGAAPGNGAGPAVTVSAWPRMYRNRTPAGPPPGGGKPGPQPRPAPATLADVPAQTPASKALSKELRQHGFVFTGPVTAYATMQACGIVNDHLADCFARASAERAGAGRPASGRAASERIGAE